MRYLDLETDMTAPLNNNLVAVCLDGEVYERRVVGDEALKALFLSIKDEVICGHNIKFDAKVVFRHYGILFEKLWCTLIAAKILRNGKREASGAVVSNALVPVLDYYLDVKESIHDSKKTIRSNFSIKRPLTPQEVEYIKADVVHLPELQKRLDALIIQDKLVQVFKLEMALTPILIKKEVKGVRVDTQKLTNLTKVWKRGKRIAVGMLDREIMNLMARSSKPCLFVTYGYRSTKQVTQIFRDFHLPVPQKRKKTANGGTIIKDSNDEDVLTEYMYENSSSPMGRFIEIYLWYKEMDKLISTYGEKLLALVDKEGYIHTEYNQLGAETSRLSSSAPNLQNVPASGHGSKVRHCFLPDEGEVFVDTDMDGAEIRIAADFSGDPLLVAAIKEGIDMHSKLASATYSILAGNPVEISKSKTPIIINGHKFILGVIRDRHKSVTFSYFYLGGPARIYTIIGDDIRKLRPHDVKATCKEVHDELGRQLPVLSKFLKAKVTEATTKGYLRGPRFNRIRYFSDKAYGDAANNDIQMTNAEAIKVAMINMDKWLTLTGYGRLVLNVHDQLITSCKPEHSEEVAKKQVEVMSESLSYFLRNLKGGSSVKIINHWEK